MNNVEYITSDRFCSLAHNYISKKKIFINITPEKNIFFVKTDCIDFFRAMILPKINYHFTLITHESDCPVNQSHLDILNNQFLQKWFGMNCHIIHEKLQPIPIGLANEEWPHGNKEILQEVSRKGIAKKNLIYCNYDFNTNLGERTAAFNILKNNKFITFDFDKRTFEEYLTILSSHKYVISPPGNSIDCHRVWESIYCNTVPVCLKSIPMVFYKDLPILFINSWEDITEANLELQYNALISKSKEKSLFSFYQKLISESV